LEGSSPLAIDESDDQTWFDPGLGVRLSAPDAGRWHLSLQGDIGGFGIGSDFAWQVYPIVGYRFSDLFEVAGSYRAISMDYTSGEGSDKFVYDLTTFGPQAGLLFRF
jgi:anti-sigma factor RsiW